MSNASIPSVYTQRATCILHPTDFTPQSDFALAHALRLAITNKAELHILHVGHDSDDENWEKFPSVRKILKQWGMIGENASRSEVTELGIRIEKITKVIGTKESVAESIEDYCALHPIDLIVLATNARAGLAALIKPSTAEKIASKVSSLMIPVLFVPAKSHGCVAIDSGKVSMENVLVPVDHHPSSDGAVESALRALVAFGSEKSNLTLLHVGSAASFPVVDIPEGSWQIERVVRQGNPAAEILSAAEESKSNLIIMVTAGTEGWMDVIRGTTTEQVVRESPCPVLTISTLDSVR